MALPGQPNASNFINKMIYDPCTTDVWVYVETFIPSFLQMWFTTSFPLIDDIVRDIGYDLTERPDGRGGRRHKHGLRRLPQDQPRGRSSISQQGLKHLLRITEPLEKIGYFFLLYNAVDRFFYNWSTLLEQEGCRGGGPIMSRHGTNIGFFPNNGIGAVACPDLGAQTPGITSSAFSCAFGGGTWDFILAIDCDGATPSSATSYSAAILVNGGLPGGIITGGTDDIGGGSGGGLMLHQTIHVPPGGFCSVGWGVQGPAIPVGMKATSCSAICYRSSVL